LLWEDGTRALALRWVASEPGTAGYLGSLALDASRNWQEFEKAMPRWKVAVGKHRVYAIADGNIASIRPAWRHCRKNLTAYYPFRQRRV